MKKMWFLLVITLLFIGCNNGDILLHEYKLLCEDLANLKTWGYKSNFDINSNKVTGFINNIQGSVQHTEIRTDFAILGEGFFKIRLENDFIGYTRSGSFHVDLDGNIVTPVYMYQLYENINLGETYFTESLRVDKERNVFISIVNNINEIIETEVGKLYTYKIPTEYLEHYKNGIYIIKDNINYQEEIIYDSHLLQGFLEMSNYPLLPAILRMYYILSVIDNKLIKNIEYKRELLKIQIEKLSDPVIPMADIIISMNNKINELLELQKENEIFMNNNVINSQKLEFPSISPIPNEIIEKYLVQRYYDIRFDSLQMILPFIEYDY